MLAATVLVLAAAAPARADILRLYAEAHGGGMYGGGTDGTPVVTNNTFFGKSTGPMYGALVGAQLLFLDAWVQHHQYAGNGNGLQTFTQFGLGIHFTIDMGTPEEQKAHQGTYTEVGAGVWYGVGTGAQVMPPLDAAQLTDQGVAFDGRLGFGKHLNNIFDLGVMVPVSYGFFTKTKGAGGVNDTNNDYRGYLVEALVVLRMNIRLL
jgi:hypothetical protein